MKKPPNLEHYLKLNYPMEMVEDGDEIVASIPDLPGCVSYGSSFDEAVKNLKAVKELWIQGRLESGQEVPEPSDVEDFSGKFVLRIPRALHKCLDNEAKKQGVSLNQYVTHLLSERHNIHTIEHLIETLLSKDKMRGEISNHFVLQISTVSTLQTHASAPGSMYEGLMGMLDCFPKPPKSIQKTSSRGKILDYAKK